MLNPKSTVLEHLGMAGLAIDEDQAWLSQQVAEVARRQTDPTIALQQIQQMMEHMSHLRHFLCELERFQNAYTSETPFAVFEPTVAVAPPLQIAAPAPTAPPEPVPVAPPVPSPEPPRLPPLEQRLRDLNAQYGPKIALGPRPEDKMMDELRAVAHEALSSDIPGRVPGPGDPSWNFRQSGSGSAASGGPGETQPADSHGPDVTGPQAAGPPEGEGAGPRPFKPYNFGRANPDAEPPDVYVRGSEAPTDLGNAPQAEAAAGQVEVPDPVIPRNKELLQEVLPPREYVPGHRSPIAAAGKTTRTLRATEYTAADVFLPFLSAILIQNPKGISIRAANIQIEENMRRAGMLNEEEKPADYKMVMNGSAPAPRWKLQTAYLRRQLIKDGYLSNVAQMFTLTDKGRAWILGHSTNSKAASSKGAQKATDTAHA